MNIGPLLNLYLSFIRATFYSLICIRTHFEIHATMFANFFHF